MAAAQPGLLARYIRRLVAVPVAASDAELLQRFLARQDEEAFAALLQRHGPMVWSVCRRVLRHTEDAEDAFQATFLVLLHRAGSIQKRSAVGSWLYGVAYRIAARAREATARRQMRERTIIERSPTDPLMDVTGSELRELLDEELNRLPEKYRAPFVLCCLEERTKAEVAQQLGWKEGTVSSRLARARDLLRSRLTRRGVALSGGLIAMRLSEETTLAAVPSALGAATQRMAVLVAAGEAASPPVTVLAKGMLEAMHLARWKIAAALLTLSLLSGGAGLVAYQNRAGQPDAVPQPALQADNAQAEDKTRIGADLFGDPLPAGALARLGTVRLRHGTNTWSVAYSPDGRTLASSGSNYEPFLRLWDSSSGQEIRGNRTGAAATKDRVLFGHGMSAIAYSPDGKLLVAGNMFFNQVSAWDTKSGQSVRGYSSLGKEPNGGVTCVAFSPDDKLIAWGSYDKTVSLAETLTGKTRFTLPQQIGSVHAVSFTADGANLIWAGQDKAIHVCDVKSGREVRRLDRHDKRVTQLRVNADGTRLASGDDGGLVRLWDLATGHLAFSCPGHSGQITGLIFTRDGKQLLSSSRDKTVRFWDVATGRALRTMPVQGIDVSSMTLSPDGRRLAVSGFEQSITVFDMASGTEILPGQGHRGWVLAAHFSPDGTTIATGSSDGTLRLWDARTGKELRTLIRDAEGWFIDFAYAPDGKTLAASAYGNEWYLLDASTGRVLRRLTEPDGHIYDVRYLPDGKTVATFSLTDNAKSYRLTLWNSATGEKIRSVPFKHWGAYAFSPDGTVMATGNESLTLCETRTGKALHTAPGRRAESIAFTPDGRTLVLSDQDGSMELWDLARWRSRRQRNVGAPNGLRHPNRLVLSPDGRLAAAIDLGPRVKVREVATLGEVCSYQGHTDGVNNVEFAPDGRTLLTSSGDGSVLVWDFLGLASKSAGTSSPLTEAALTNLWSDLSDEDAARAYRAVAVLARAPRQSVPFLRDHLRPARHHDERELVQWAADLNDPRFAVRQKAMQELARAEGTAEAVLRRTLATRPALEARQRIEQLLGRIEEGPDHRSRRALAVLEYVNTEEARQVLQTLAGGAPGTWLTAEAHAALVRLKSRP
jgi:RNA polymerase sigma factor (sigma-70 family)